MPSFGACALLPRASPGGVLGLLLLALADLALSHLVVELEAVLDLLPREEGLRCPPLHRLVLGELEASGDQRS